jgi:phage gp46-like protein
MVDIRLVQNPHFPALSVPVDINLLPNGTLDTRDDIVTAVLVAFCTDALAQPSDILPDPHSADRKGWWGDVDAEEIWGGWPIGWRGWLLRRAKITDAGAREGATVTRVQDFLFECLTPFIQKRILTNFDLIVQRNVHNRQEIDAFVVLYRQQNEIRLKFAIFSNVSSVVPVPSPSNDGPVYVVIL